MLRLVSMTVSSVRARRRIAALAAVLAVAACGSTPSGLTQGGGPESTPTFHAPDVAITPADQSKGVAPSSLVTVAAHNGEISGVTVVQATTGAPVAGTVLSDKRTWMATETLTPDASYTVKAAVIGVGGAATTAVSTFTTTGGKHLITQVLPANGSTVGVGEPITLKFNKGIPAAQQKALLSRIVVASTPSVTGGWHWFSNSEVHFRPAEYWPTGTNVAITAKLKGVDAGGGYWGYGDWNWSFKIGEKHVTDIDDKTSTMKVFVNDAQVRTVPVSLGKAGFPTLSGTLVVQWKAYSVMMDSCASGIECRTWAANYYKDYVYYDTAISTNGFFIHAAPWSVYAQGRYDVSHGCVNVSPANAQWYYNFAQPGDVVIIRNTGRVADAGDGEGDWQIGWAKWQNSGGTIQTPSAHGGGGV